MMFVKVFIAIILALSGLGGVDDILIWNGMLILQNLGTDL